MKQVAGTFIEIIFAILIFIIPIVIWLFINSLMRDNCINDGGKVITNEYGIFEKCIK